MLCNFLLPYPKRRPSTFSTTGCFVTKKNAGIILEPETRWDSKQNRHLARTLCSVTSPVSWPERIYFRHHMKDQAVHRKRTEGEISGILEKLWHSYFWFLSNYIPYIKNSTEPPLSVQLLKTRRGLQAVPKLINYPAQSKLCLQNTLCGRYSSFLHWGMKLVHVLWII